VNQGGFMGGRSRAARLAGVPSGYLERTTGADPAFQDMSDPRRNCANL